MKVETGENKAVRRVTNWNRLTTKVVTAVAEVNDVSPTDLDEKLYDAIDPDGLELIFATEDDDLSPMTHLVFTMAGCKVVVYSDGQIIVTSKVQTAEGEAGQFEASE